MPTQLKKAEFERFYHEHLDKVYRFVFFRVGGNKALAEDLVSEIFLKALEHFGDYDVNISRSAWIMTITRNHLANHWRDRKPVDGLPNDNIEDSDGKWVEMANNSLNKHLLKREALALLDKLEKEPKEIVTFHYIYGYSYAEIGKMKGMTETAVKVAAHRAIKKLSAEIKK